MDNGQPMIGPHQPYPYIGDVPPSNEPVIHTNHTNPTNPTAHFSVDGDGRIKQNYSTAQRSLCPNQDACLHKCEDGRCWNDEVIDKDAINPSHYKSHPSGVECITVVEHMGFNLGNAMKYIWRADLKNNAIEDLRKAAWYLEREIKRRESS